MCVCRQYVRVIDLTEEDEEDAISSDPDDQELPVVSLWYNKPLDR